MNIRSFILPVCSVVLFTSAPLIPPLVRHVKWIDGIATSHVANRTVTAETTTGPLQFDAREQVPLISPGTDMEFAIVRSEDSRFWSRRGAFDPQAVVSAMLRRGASTIPMQLARVEQRWITRPEKSAHKGFHFFITRATRKLFEVRYGDLALSVRTHRGVLRDYASLVPTPSPGVDAACLREFGKGADEVSPDQAVAVTALLPAPGRRLRSREEWQEATSRRDVDVGIPSTPLLGTVYPLGSLLSHPNLVLDPGITRKSFLLGHRFLQENRGLSDLVIIVIDNGRPAALVDSCRSGIRKPWPCSTIGQIRMDSVFKVFTAAEIIASGMAQAGLGSALERSDNLFFIGAADQIGRSTLERRLEHYGLKNRTGFSPLGRCWVAPLDLALAVDSCVRECPRLEELLREVPRRGTAASALREWPAMPSEVWSKTGTSPASPLGSAFLIVGGDGGRAVLIWAKSHQAHGGEAGPLLGPLFSKILRDLPPVPRHRRTIANVKSPQTR